MTITAEHFTKRVGSPPVMDDLDRCNCPDAGELGHWNCGWCAIADLPVFCCIGCGRGEHADRATVREADAP